jgi:hypothetical protein
MSTVINEADELYEMTNLYPSSTGLPMTVWVSPRGRARHGARIKVSTAHGPRMTIENTAVVRLQPSPRLIAGELSAGDQEYVFEWVVLNRDVLLDFWDGKIDGIGLAQRLRPLPKLPPIPGLTSRQRGEPPAGSRE